MPNGRRPCSANLPSILPQESYSFFFLFVQCTTRRIFFITTCIKDHKHIVFQNKEAHVSAKILAFKNKILQKHSKFSLYDICIINLLCGQNIHNQTHINDEITSLHLYQYLVFIISSVHISGAERIYQKRHLLLRKGALSMKKGMQ